MSRSLKKKRPMVVEAYMTHSTTPFITERLVDGRIRKVARKQIGDSASQLARLKETYGKRWTGIRSSTKSKRKKHRA